MTNLERLSQIDVMADLLHETDAFDTEFCHDCKLEGDKIQKVDCLKCIKRWLMEQVPADDGCKPNLLDGYHTGKTERYSNW